MGRHRLEIRLASFWLVVAATVMGLQGAADATIASGKSGSAVSSATTSVTVSPTWSAGGSSSNGNLLVAVVAYRGTGAAITATGWTRAGTPAVGTNINVAIYYIPGASAVTGGTFTCVGTGTQYLSVQLAEYSGIVASSPLDTGTYATNTAVASNSFTVTPGATTAIGPELVIAGLGEDDKWGAGTVPTGFTALGELTAANAITSDSYFRAGVGSGSDLTTVLSLTGSKTGDLAGVVASFKGTSTTYYWVGGRGLTGCASGTLLASNGSCWATSSGGATTGTAPNSADNAVFDGVGGATGDCSWDVLTVSALTTQGLYTGTITQAAQNTTVSGTMTISAGAYSGHATSTLTATSNLVVSGGSFTGHGAAVSVVGLTVSSGGAFAANTSAVNASGVVTLSGGTAAFGSAASAFQNGLTASGAAVTLTSGTTTVTGAVTVSAGSVSFPGTFTTTGLFTQSGGTVTTTSAAAITFGTSIGVLSSAFTMTGGTFTHSGGTLGTTSGTTTDISGTATFNGTGGTQNIRGQLNITGGTMTLGAATMNTGRAGGGNPGNAGTDHLVTVGAGAILAFASSFTFPATVSAMTIAGTINAGSGTISFTTGNAVTLSGTYNASSSTTSFASTDPLTLSGTYNAGSGSTTFGGAVALSGTFNASTGTGTATFTGALTMTGTSAFNGNTGTGTFGAAPTLTAGTFTVGTSGTTGKYTFSLGATFSSGMTLTFPANAGELATVSGQTLSVAGTINVTTTGTTKPKIDCPACTTNQGFTMTFTSTATLNINGLQFDHVSTAGVQIANGATYTALKNVKFTNNAAGGITSGTHLAIAKANSLIVVPGCYFDATAKYNVTLSGVSGSTGVRAIFESQSTAVNGARAGAAYDLDADTNGDNVADTTTTPRFGSVVEWANATQTVSTGGVVGFPTAAFDWNTFSYYGVYVAFQDTGSSATLYVRNNDGSAHYSFSVSGTLVGTPFWDTDAATGTHVVYLATSNGRITKLIDDGTSLARPSTGVWTSDFTDATHVASITSPLISDGTNLYFGGTDTSSPSAPAGAIDIFGVQVATGLNEGTLQRELATLSPVTATPGWTTSSGDTIIFLGSTAQNGNAYMYRMDMTSGSITGSYTTAAASSINGGVVYSSGRAFGVSDQGKMYVLSALASSSAGFTDLWGPNTAYNTTKGNAIKFGPWVDYSTAYAYFGDDGGWVFCVNDLGVACTSFPPLQISSSIKITSTPMYRAYGGVIVVGANDGYVYFIDRSAQSVFKRFLVSTGTTPSVSSIAYDNNISSYMVGTADGKLIFINAADVVDPTPGTP